MFFAKVIGCANVIRNQKVLDFREDLLNNRKSLQGYSHIKKRENLEFLK